MKRIVYRITIKVGKRIYNFRYPPEEEEARIIDAIKLVEDKNTNFDFRAFCLFITAANAVKKLKTGDHIIVSRNHKVSPLKFAPK